jgi:hypothetical protein
MEDGRTDGRNGEGAPFLASAVIHLTSAEIVEGSLHDEQRAEQQMENWR